MGIGVAVEDNLVDEVGAVSIHQQLDLFLSYIEMLRDIDAKVPRLFHFWGFEEQDLS